MNTTYNSKAEAINKARELRAAGCLVRIVNYFGVRNGAQYLRYVVIAA